MRAVGAGVLVTFFLTAFGATPAESAYQEMPVNRGLTRPVYAAEADASIQCFGHNFWRSRNGRDGLQRPITRRKT